MIKTDKAWKSFEDAFRAILQAHKEFFGLSHVELGPAKATATSGYVYDIEVLGFAKGDEKIVLFECRRKSRNLEPKDAGELAYRISATGAKNAYFVTTFERGLAEGAKRIADFERIGHIRLSADASPYDYIMEYASAFFVGKSSRIGASASVEGRDSAGNLIGER